MYRVLIVMTLALFACDAKDDGSGADAATGTGTGGTGSGTGNNATGTGTGAGTGTGTGNAGPVYCHRDLPFGGTLQQGMGYNVFGRFCSNTYMPATPPPAGFVNMAGGGTGDCEVLFELETSPGCVSGDPDTFIWGFDDLPYDVWVDGDGGIQTTTHGTIDGSGRLGGIPLQTPITIEGTDIRVEFSIDYGSVVTITALELF